MLLNWPIITIKMLTVIRISIQINITPSSTTSHYFEFVTISDYIKAPSWNTWLVYVNWKNIKWNSWNHTHSGRYQGQMKTHALNKELNKSLQQELLKALQAANIFRKLIGTFTGVWSHFHEKKNCNTLSPGKHYAHTHAN